MFHIRLFFYLTFAFSSAIVLAEEAPKPTEIKELPSGETIYKSQRLEIQRSRKQWDEQELQKLIKSNERFITFGVENDYFGDGSDQDFTNGLQLTYFNVGQDQPEFVRWIDKALPFFKITNTTSTYYTLGQNLYTPDDIAAHNPDPIDRPYGALLYVSTGLSNLHGRHLDTVETTLGWVGPYALGDEVQTNFHKLKGVTIPEGWGKQIGNELGLMVSYERQWLSLLSAHIHDQLSIRISPSTGATLGNIYTYAHVGGTISILPKRQSLQAPPMRVRPAVAGSGFFDTGSKNWSWMLFVGIDSRWMLHNIFLDGNTFKDSRSVKRRPMVYDLMAGGALTFKRLRFSYTINWRSKEFDSPLAKRQAFGALSVGYRF